MPGLLKTKVDLGLPAVQAAQLDLPRGVQGIRTGNPAMLCHSLMLPVGSTAAPSSSGHSSEPSLQQPGREAAPLPAIFHTFTTCTSSHALLCFPATLWEEKKKVIKHLMMQVAPSAPPPAAAPQPSFPSRYQRTEVTTYEAALRAALTQEQFLHNRSVVPSGAKTEAGVGLSLLPAYTQGVLYQLSATTGLRGIAANYSGKILMIP